jgi:hypothetical protein
MVSVFIDRVYLTRKREFVRAMYSPDLQSRDHVSEVFSLNQCREGRNAGFST